MPRWIPAGEGEFQPRKGKVFFPPQRVTFRAFHTRRAIQFSWRSSFDRTTWGQFYGSFAVCKSATGSTRIIRHPIASTLTAFPTAYCCQVLRTHVRFQFVARYVFDFRPAMHSFLQKWTVAGHIIIEWAPGRKKSAKKKRIIYYEQIRNS
jgi:hypothetical protein